jgi:hypothetical protein
MTAGNLARNSQTRIDHQAGNALEIDRGKMQQTMRLH